MVNGHTKFKKEEKMKEKESLCSGLVGSMNRRTSSKRTIPSGSWVRLRGLWRIQELPYMPPVSL